MQPVAPPETINQLNNIFKQLESQTGSMFQITLTKFGPENRSVVIGAFPEKRNIRVKNAQSDFTEIVGDYETFTELENKIRQLAHHYKFNEHLVKENDTLYGKCPSCKTNNPVNLIACQNCYSRFPESKWSGIVINHGSGEIHYIDPNDTNEDDMPRQKIAEFEFIKK